MMSLARTGIAGHCSRSRGGAEPGQLIRAVAQDLSLPTGKEYAAHDAGSVTIRRLRPIGGYEEGPTMADEEQRQRAPINVRAMAMGLGLVLGVWAGFEFFEENEAVGILAGVAAGSGIGYLIGAIIDHVRRK